MTNVTVVREQGVTTRPRVTTEKGALTCGYAGVVTVVTPFWKVVKRGGEGHERRCQEFALEG